MKHESQIDNILFMILSINPLTAMNTHNMYICIIVVLL